MPGAATRKVSDSKKESPKLKWEIYMCDNMFCDGRWRHWPVKENDDSSEQICPSCQTFGHRLTKKERGELHG